MNDIVLLQVLGQNRAFLEVLVTGLSTQHVDNYITVSKAFSNYIFKKGLFWYMFLKTQVPARLLLIHANQKQSNDVSIDKYDPTIDYSVYGRLVFKHVDRSWGQNKRVMMPDVEFGFWWDDLADRQISHRIFPSMFNYQCIMDTFNLTFKRWNTEDAIPLAHDQKYVLSWISKHGHRFFGDDCFPFDSLKLFELAWDIKYEIRAICYQT